MLTFALAPKSQIPLR